MIGGMKLELSCLPRWTSAWAEEWQRNLYLEVTILQQVTVNNGFSSNFSNCVHSFKGFFFNLSSMYILKF